MNNSKIEIIDQIVEKYKNGSSIDDIATDMGIDSISVFRIFISGLCAINIITEEDKREHKRNIKPKKINKSNKKKQEPKHRCIENKKLDFETLKYEYTQLQLSIKEISKKHDCSYTLVNNLLNEYGLKYKKLDYPMNLIRKITGGIEIKCGIDDALKGLEYCLNEFVNEREKNVLIKHNKHHSTLRDIGKEVGVSYNRIRQIECNGIKKLMKPTIRKYIIYGYDGYVKIRENEIKEINRKRVSMENINVSIDDVGFTAREYNGLRRGGINRLGDIESIEQLYMIRNLGRKSINNIVNKLHNYGIEIQ